MRKKSYIYVSRRQIFSVKVILMANVNDSSSIGGHDVRLHLCCEKIAQQRTPPSIGQIQHYPSL